MPENWIFTSGWAFSNSGIHFLVKSSWSGGNWCVQTSSVRVCWACAWAFPVKKAAKAKTRMSKALKNLDIFLSPNICDPAPDGKRSVANVQVGEQTAVSYSFLL